MSLQPSETVDEKRNGRCGGVDVRCITWEDFRSNCSQNVLSSKLCEHPERIYQVLYFYLI